MSTKNSSQVCLHEPKAADFSNFIENSDRKCAGQL